MQSMNCCKHVHLRIKKRLLVKLDADINVMLAEW